MLGVLKKAWCRIFGHHENMYREYMINDLNDMKSDTDEHIFHKCDCCGELMPGEEKYLSDFDKRLIKLKTICK